MAKFDVAYLCFQITREGQASHAHVNEIIKGLRRRGWNVKLFEPEHIKEGKKFLLLRKLFGFIGVQTRLWKEAKNVKVLYIRSHFAVLPTLLWCKLHRIPVILESNGHYDELFLVYPWTKVLSPLFRLLMWAPIVLSTSLIVNTEGLVEWTRRRVGAGRKPIYQIPCGANTDLFNPDARANYSLPKPYVIFFGAFAEWQGIETLVKAAETPEWPQEVSLVIAGDGAKKPLVEEASARNRNIIYLGKIPYKDVPGIIVGSIAGLSPKNNRGGHVKVGLSPLKVYETLACGVPVIVTDIPGQTELAVKYKCGLVIPLDDPVELARAVEYLYEHPSERETMGLRGREIVESEHSWDSRADDTDRVIRDILSGNTARVNPDVAKER